MSVCVCVRQPGRLGGERREKTGTNEVRLSDDEEVREHSEFDFSVM